MSDDAPERPDGSPEEAREPESDPVPPDPVGDEGGAPGEPIEGSEGGADFEQPPPSQRGDE